VSKSGFVSLSYGQRRPLQPARRCSSSRSAAEKRGLQPAARRRHLGRILDEDGEAVPGATVRVMRYQYQQGDRRLTQVGTAQTDDRGQYRVWGLMPGDYYVNALTRIPASAARWDRAAAAVRAGRPAAPVAPEDEAPRWRRSPAVISHR
jgi:hypothetical protein